jgi:hypothetical protein
MSSANNLDASDRLDGSTRPSILTRPEETAGQSTFWTLRTLRTDTPPRRSFADVLMAVVSEVKSHGA